MANRLLSAVEAVIEIQATLGGSNREVLDVSTDMKPALGDITQSYGGITRKYRLSALTNKPVPRPVQRDQPEPTTADLTVLATAWSYMEQFDADSRFALYVRHPATHAGNPLDFVRVDILTDVALESKTLSAPVIGEPSTDDTTLTSPINAASMTTIVPVAGTRVVTGFTSADDCNATHLVRDEDGVLYGVTEADSTGTHPFLLKSTDNGSTWTETELTAITADCTGLCMAGDYLVIAAGTTIAVYTKAGVQVSSYTASAAINVLAAIDAANIVAAGASGLILSSDDGGLSWAALTSGVATALNSIAIRNINEWFIGGASGVLLKYASGTLSTVTLPGALSAATINTIAIPYAPTGFSRDQTVYIGASTGTVYQSDDDGANWEQYEYPDDGAGSVTALAFTEFLGQVLYVLHTNAGGDSILKRDWSGGVGGTNNAESVSVPANSGLNALALLDANTALVAGNVHSTADMIVKVANSL